MKYLSLCSGIEAATVAWHPLGWEAVAYSEIERFPSEVLAHHYPNTPNLGDMTKFKEWTNVSNVDLLVGGTPCQSFSVAGLRKGLDDPRGNLMLTFLAIAKQYRPNWLVWENVPGVLSSNGGRDFGSFLGGLAVLGYGFAYRVLDAQYFGVAQRRRRVFVVGYLGDWRAAAAVLFERHSLQGHPAPSRETRKKTSFTTGTSVNVSYDMKQHHNPQPSNTVQLTTKNCIGVRGDTPLVQPIPLNSMNCFRSPDADPSTGCGIGEAGEAMFTITKTNSHAVAQPIPIHDQATRHAGKNGDKTMGKGNGLGIGQAGEPMNTLTKGDRHAVAQPIAYNISPGKGALKEDIHVTDADATKTLDASASNPAMHQGGTAILQAMAVRRLTPTECERLQGFPDNYTDIKSKNKPTPDGPRYKALGNSMAVPVMAWIGERIKQYEEMA